MEIERKEKDIENGNHELLLIVVITVSFIRLFLLKIISSVFHIPNFSQSISVNWLFGIWKYTLNPVVPFIIEETCYCPG